jgi:3-isopropylmalate/(R)-2-methylmalate dehydratase small subunit
MQPFAHLTAVAAPIDLPNVDTDRIIPARFLRKPQGSPGYERFLFHDVRFNADGSDKPDFVLNQLPTRETKILVAAENFGCGSSREAAVWALLAYGIRVVIAPSLGDIFHQNCFKNGVLPVILPAAAADLRQQLHERPGATLTVDLGAQAVTAPDGALHRFEIDAFSKHKLLAGQDDITLTLGYEAQLREFEARHRAEMPWLVVTPPAR